MNRFDMFYINEDWTRVHVVVSSHTETNEPVSKTEYGINTWELRDFRFGSFIKNDRFFDKDFEGLREVPKDTFKLLYGR